MPRFFVEDIREGMVFVGGEDGRHMVRSLRMRPGETVTLCDGAGRDYPGVISSCQEEGAWVQVEAGVPSRGEPATQVTVCQCLSKGDKLDTVTQRRWSWVRRRFGRWRAPAAWPSGTERRRRKSGFGCRKSPGRPPCKAAGASFPRWGKRAL